MLQGPATYVTSECYVQDRVSVKHIAIPYLEAYPFMLSAVLVVDRLLLPSKLLRERILTGDDADLLAKLGGLRRQRVNVEAVSGGLSACLTERFDEGLLFVRCDGSVAEEDDTSLGPEVGSAVRARRFEGYSHEDSQVSQLLGVVQDFPNAQGGLSVSLVIDEFGTDGRGEVDVGVSIERSG
jgi:hypothetical protein